MTKEQNISNLSREDKIELIELLDVKHSRIAKNSLVDFILYCKSDYQVNWHHKLICDKLQGFWSDPDKKKLMLFVPPQHGKSEIVSRFFPSFVLGLNPDIKIVAASYSSDLSKSFNRDVQRIIESKEYRDVFPKTMLNSERVASDSGGQYLRNTEEFEIVNKKGSYKSVGVTSGLSGRPVDLGIIDDPIKDSIEASSTVYRERIWEWYISVLEARLHNDSKVVLIMTRWHQDDLAGRLLKHQPNEWDVIKIPAIKEEGGDKEDTRTIGEALWPKKHSLTKLLKTKKLSPTSFESLYQQNPIPKGGGKVKKDWFQFCHEKEVPRVTWDLWVDGAYTESTKNDPSGLMLAGFHERTKKLYIKHAHSAFMEMPEMLKFIGQYGKLHDLRGRSRIRFEPKASGKSFRQMVNAVSKMSAVEIKSHLVQEGKEARLQTASPKIEAGKVVLVEGTWNKDFIHQITGYPNVKHDEYVDLIGYACDLYFDQGDDEMSVRVDN